MDSVGLTETTRIPDAAPDWAAIDREVPCSRCGYDLRMLVEPRCPECGLAFRWADLVGNLDTAGSWLFEHQRRKRPLRSFLQTALLATFNPWRFWNRVSISWRVDVTGATIQVLVAAMIPSAARVLVLLVAAAVVEIWGWADPQTMSWGMRSGPTAQRFVVQTLFQVARQAGWLRAMLGLGLLTGMFCVTLWVVMNALRQTMVRYRVRDDQLWRVICSSALGTLGVASILAVTFEVFGAIALVRLFCPRTPAALAWASRVWDRVPVVSLVAIGALFWWVTFSLGLGRYLGLPRSWLIALLTSAIAVLLLATAPVVVSVLVS